MSCMRSRLLPILVLAATACACIPPTAAVAASKTGRGCGKAATPGVTTQHLVVSGVDRQYLLSVPASYRKDTPAPLVLDFHGLGSNMQQQSIYSRLDQKGSAEGYIVITPDGAGDVIQRWVPPPLPGSDLDFVKAILSTSRRTLCIDARRVFATGISNGAIFSTALAGTPPTAVLAFHGTADPIVPYAGGAYFSGAPFSSDMSASAALRAIAGRFGGLRAQPVDVEHVVYPDCPPSGAVELYRVLGGGHTWPGGIAVSAERLGATTTSIDATALMLAFFDAHPRKG